MDKNISFVIRIAVIAVAVLDAFSNGSSFDTALYVLLVLLFFLNTQLRATSLKGNFLLLSLFLDLALVYAIWQTYPGLTPILLAISVTDALLQLEWEGLIFSGLNAAFLFYYLYDKDGQQLLLALLIYIILIPLLLQVKQYRKKVSETEYLYDENRRYSYQLERVKKRLESYSEKVEQLSQEEERGRISAEIHDTVGHKLTGTLMQLEAALLMLSRDFDKGIETVKAVRDNLKDSIEILRQTVKKMRPQQTTVSLGALRELVEDFQQSTGINISFQVKGRPGKMYPSAEMAFFKNAREALTNAARHGNAQNIEVVLEYGLDEVRLRVRDDGIGSAGVNKGMGISAMEERAAMLGGEVNVASSVNEGFEITTVLPIR